MHARFTLLVRAGNLVVRRKTLCDSIPSANLPVSLMRKRRRVLKLLGLGFAVVVLATVLSGCQAVSYYKQAIRGQYQIFANRERIEDLIANTNTPPRLREKFRLVMEVRRFAENELKLPGGRPLQPLRRRQKALCRLECPCRRGIFARAETWWYPVVGRLKYRGYFSEKHANAYAKKLEAEGLDVYVGGVEAYSTLGWFKDPLLNTFIHHDEMILAEILFHELAHQRVFVSGDTDFNEAFATAVAEEGVRRWFKDKPEKLEQFRIHEKRDADFVRIVLATREHLKSVYARSNDSPAALRHDKLLAIEELRQEYAQDQTRGVGWLLRIRRLVQAADQQRAVEHHRDLPPFCAFIPRAAAQQCGRSPEILQASRISRQIAEKGASPKVIGGSRDDRPRARNRINQGN